MQILDSNWALRVFVARNINIAPDRVQTGAWRTQLWTTQLGQVRFHPIFDSILNISLKSPQPYIKQNLPESVGDFVYLNHVCKHYLQLVGNEVNLIKMTQQHLLLFLSALVKVRDQAFWIDSRAKRKNCQNQVCLPKQHHQHSIGSLPLDPNTQNVLDVTFVNFNPCKLKISKK